MNTSQSLVAVTVGAIVITTIASGPLVNGVDLTSHRENGQFQQAVTADHATVRVIEEPIGPVVLDRAEFGNDVYLLRVPPVVVLVTEVQGTPRVSYHVRIFGLNYGRLTAYFFNDTSVGEQHVIRVTEDAIDPSKVTESEYRGDLTVQVHDGNGTEVIYRTNTTVVVRG